ncbi:MAG: SAM-dependent methyltransferase [Bacteroidota bacterium]
MQKTGTIVLIPIPIADNALSTLSADVAKYTLQIQHFFVENLRTARRFLKALHPSIVIDNLNFSEIDKHTGPDISQMKRLLNEGHTIGIMSEAGCPGIADPGAELVHAAQSMGSKIIPLVGPNSLILALMASGLNGQSFCFNGYLPVKDPMRSQRIKALEQQSIKEKQTQLFIETPYRNDVLMADLLKHCAANTQLCIAQNITAPDAVIKTQSIEKWRKNIPALGKVPMVFLILA